MNPKKPKYSHKCDSCGNIFEDNKTGMDHCMDMNGMVLCDECDYEW